ncbi:cytochrome P450 [Podospora didyma]|uniref:Cytochrome P450 n=1 Tax=Podospora didyma TaxID=330526 RepID=A0AAE0NYK3_9PEZI|nr:cytochrome P450 [Podospora didyma]
MAIQGLISSLSELQDRNGATIAIFGVGAVLLCALYAFRFKADDGPPRVPETIPFVSHTFQFATKPHSFMAHVLKTMQNLKTDIVRARLAGRNTFLVVGEEKTNALFRPNTGLLADFFVNLLVGVMWDLSEKDLDRWVADKTGRLKVPTPGYEHVAQEDRLWLGWHHLLAENLARTKPTNDLTTLFLDKFTAKIASLFPAPTNEWHPMRVRGFLVEHQTDAAARALSGDFLFDKNPSYFDAMRNFELAILPISFGPPKWIRPEPHRHRRRYIDMNRKYYREALKEFDWNSPAASSPWEPVFGSPLIRELGRWALAKGMDEETIAGILGIQVVNQNSNAVPASVWAIMDTLTFPDPALLKNVRAEADAAFTLDPTTGKATFDVSKLVASPWLQAVYTEVLRLRNSFSITREAHRDTEVDGVPIPKGSLVQAPIPIAHLHAVWETEGYPAGEFWPQRHIKTVETVDAQGRRVTQTEFSLGKRCGYYFPYGGGPTMCPGRHFAKQEIIASLALFMAEFDVEVMGWVMSDGSPSDRKAGNGKGFAICQPDRDLEVRVRKRW